MAKEFEITDFNFQFHLFYRYFFLVFAALIVLGVFNGLVFLPVLLIMIGPPAEVVPSDNSDSLAPPSPEVMAASTASRKAAGSRLNKLNNATSTTLPLAAKMANLNHARKHHNYSDLSLSTIAEESGSFANSNSNIHHHQSTSDLRRSTSEPPLTSQSLNGASVFVEPHVVVETTTFPANVRFDFKQFEDGTVSQIFFYFLGEWKLVKMLNAKSVATASYQGDSHCQV